MAVAHTIPGTSTVLPPKVTEDTSVANTALTVSTVWEGPFVFGLVVIKWDAAPGSVTTKVELLPGGVVADAIELVTNTGTEVLLVWGPAQGLRGLVFRESDVLRVTVPAGGSDRISKVWIYSGNPGR